jgi:Phasin protein
MADSNTSEKQENDHQETNRQRPNHQENNQQDQKQASQLCEASSAVLDAAMPVNSFSGANFEIFSQAMTLPVQGMMAVQEELLKFVVSRMNKDMQMAQRLMSGDIAGGALNSQSEYLREMMQDYANGSQKLMERALQLAKERATLLEERTDAAAQVVKPEQGQVAAE